MHSLNTASPKPPMPLPEHEHALTLSLLIHAEKLHRLDTVGFELCMADVIKGYLGSRGYSEEKMADLYALLAESVTPNMMHSELRVACNKALIKNDQWSRP